MKKISSLPYPGMAMPDKWDTCPPKGLMVCLKRVCCPCEESLLAEVNGESRAEDRVPLEAFDVCAGFSAEQVQALREVVEVRRYAAGDLIIQMGEQPTALGYFLAADAGQACSWTYLAG